jgi:hypothetical protein
MTWQDVSDNGSKFITLAKAAKKVKPLITYSFSLVLEEVSKNWSHPYNWRLTCSDDKARVLWQETFYLNVECNNLGTAQLRADALYTKYADEL